MVESCSGAQRAIGSKSEYRLLLHSKNIIIRAYGSSADGSCAHWIGYFRIDVLEIYLEECREGISI
jgi:hypothetical protein